MQLNELTFTCTVFMAAAHKLHAFTVTLSSVFTFKCMDIGYNQSAGHAVNLNRICMTDKVTETNLDPSLSFL